MKTVNQLLEKYADDYSEIDNVLIFHYNDLMQFVPYKKALPHLKEKVTPAEWGEYYLKLSKNNVKKVMKQYMSFAWEKVCGHRGISATRNLAHFKAWLWILEEYRLITFLDNPRNFPCYGAPVLAEICKRFNWDHWGFISPRYRETATQFIEGKGC